MKTPSIAIAVTALALLGTTAMVAHAQSIAPGSYIYEGGHGTLDITADKHFSINTVGGNAHTCDLEGLLQGNRSTLADTQCVLTFKPQGSNVQVDTNGHESCRDSCGMRAVFEGLYIKPAPACTPGAVAKTRKAFKGQYDRKDYSTAVQTLAPLLRDCTQVLHRFDDHWIRNDLALAQARSGDKAACLVTLQPLVELATMTDDDIRDMPEPTFVPNYLSLAKAARTNLRLCKAANGQ